MSKLDLYTMLGLLALGLGGMAVAMVEACVSKEPPPAVAACECPVGVSP